MASSLTDAQRSTIAKKVGAKASVLSSAVVKLYLASPNPKANRKDPNCILNTWRDLTDSSWKNTHIMGGLVLVVDRQLDTYLLRIFDLDTYELRFEYELYEDIDYKELDKQFHAFEMDDCVAGLAFALAEEAPRFLSKVNAIKPTAKSNAVDALKGKKKEKSGGAGLFGRKKKPTAPTKPMQVSAVTNVVHTQHIGINADGTFDLNNISPEWKALFRQAGIKKKDLTNPETAKAIAETIAATTGMRVVQTPAMVPQMTDDDMKTAGFTTDQIREYDEYQAALAKYEADLAAYEAEQGALAAWERDNAAFLAEQAKKEEEERKKREAEERKAARAPPAQPPRKPNAAASAEGGAVPPARRRSSLLGRMFGGAAPSADAEPPPSPGSSPPPEAELEAQAQAKARVDAERRRLDEEQAEQNRLALEAERLREEQAAAERKREEENRRLQTEHEGRLAGIRRREGEEIERERQKARELAEQARREQDELMAQLNAMKEQRALAEAERQYAEKLADIARREKEEIAAEQRRAKDAAEAEQRQRDTEMLAEMQRAREAAEAAAREQLEIMESLRRMQQETAVAKRALEEEQRKAEEIAALARKKRPPPLPSRLPEKPPLPPLPSAPPRPPPAPSLPLMSKPSAAPSKPAGGLNLAEIGQVKLNKNEVINDKSAPNVTGKAGRPQRTNALLSQIEGGAARLKAAPAAPSGAAALPEVKNMDSNVQVNIMAKLVETMAMRRGALVGDSDDDDGWSD